VNSRRRVSLALRCFGFRIHNGKSPELARVNNAPNTATAELSHVSFAASNGANIPVTGLRLYGGFARQLLERPLGKSPSIS